MLHSVKHCMHVVIMCVHFKALATVNNYEIHRCQFGVVTPISGVLPTLIAPGAPSSHIIVFGYDRMHRNVPFICL